MSEAPVAILTGGAQGLGAAICKVLLDNGYKSKIFIADNEKNFFKKMSAEKESIFTKVCVSDVQEEKGSKFVKEQQKKYGAENVKFTVCDVAKEDDYEKLFKFAIKEFKKIDLVLNNAGIVLEQNPRKLVEVNLLGPIFGCQLALKYMGKSNGGKGGMVINTSSLGGFLPFHGGPVYHASKHGVIGLTRSYGLPYHFDRDGVMFTALCPNFTDTNILRDCATNMLVKGYDPINLYPHELMTPEYVAKGVLKLLEDKINGSTLAVTKKGYIYIGYQEELKEYMTV